MVEKDGMDYYDISDGGSRPRLQMQSAGGGNSGAEERRSGFGKVHAGICSIVGLLLLGLGLGVLVGVWQFVVVWSGLSLVLGPFAPPLLTGGDCRVGVGEPVLPEDDEDDPAEKIGGQGGKSHHYLKSRERYAPRQAVEVVNGSAGGLEQNSSTKLSTKRPSQGAGGNGPVEEEEEGEQGEKGWSLDDVDLLKKLIVKHPRGTLRRWDVIAEALGGKHNVDSVVKMSKALGQKKVGGVDAYSRFLSQRKVADVSIASPLSRRDDVGDQQGQGKDDEAVLTAAESDEPSGGGKGKWTDAEDKALLTALKTFPKDSPMRWDKVALALPGRSKAQCFRRFSELRKSFRSTIGGGATGHED